MDEMRLQKRRDAVGRSGGGVLVARVGLLVLLVLSCGSAVHAQDEVATDEVDTEVVLDPSIWILDFHVEAVRNITLLEGLEKGEVFWYAVYRVENNTGQDRQAYISVTATSDREKNYSDTHLASVERAIERKVGQPLWGKVDLYAEQKDRDSADDLYNYTTFKAGEKRRCVAVLQKLDPAANHIKITVRGLSNDLQLMGDEGEETISERVYVLEYERPRDPYQISLDSFHLKRKGWEKLATKVVIPPEKNEEEGEDQE